MSLITLDAAPDCQIVLDCECGWSVKLGTLPNLEDVVQAAGDHEQVCEHVSDDPNTPKTEE